MSVKARARSSADHIDGKAAAARNADPEAEVGGDAVDMGAFDPFQILSGAVTGLLFEHLQPLKRCLDVVTVDEGAARAQADFWNSDMTGRLMAQHDEMLHVAAGVTANWAGKGGEGAASAEFVARHVALQELIRAVCKGCEAVGWLIGKAADLMVKVRNQVKQRISELLANIMERAAMALATSWIPVVDVAAAAEFVAESAIRIAVALEEIESLFVKAKTALEKAKQVLADLEDGVGQIHDVLAALGADAPSLTTLSEGVAAISAPVGEASDFVEQAAPLAGAAGGGQGHSGGGGSPAPWQPGGWKPQPGDSSWKQGPGGGYKGSAGARSLPPVDGKPANPRRFAAMADHGGTVAEGGAGLSGGSQSAAAAAPVADKTGSGARSDPL